MRASLSFFLLLTVSIQLMHRTGILAHFSVNQAEIARTICVKKNVTGNTCQGKCHLKKMLKASEDADARAPATGVRDVIMPLGMPVQSVCVFFPRRMNEPIQAHLSAFPLGNSPSIFHPPKG